MAAASTFAPLAGLKSGLRYGVFLLGFSVGVRAWHQAYEEREEHHHHAVHEAEHTAAHKQHELEQEILRLKAENQRLNDVLHPQAAFERKKRIFEEAHKPNDVPTFEQAASNPELAKTWIEYHLKQQQ